MFAVSTAASTIRAGVGSSGERSASGIAGDAVVSWCMVTKIALTGAHTR
jgi:hypothetical protein